MTTTKAKKVHVSARVARDFEIDVTEAAFWDYCMEFISEEGLWDEFVRYIINVETGEDVGTDIRDTDIVIP